MKFWQCFLDQMVRAIVIKEWPRGLTVGPGWYGELSPLRLWGRLTFATLVAYPILRCHTIHPPGCWTVVSRVVGRVKCSKRMPG